IENGTNISIKSADFNKVVKTTDLDDVASCKSNDSSQLSPVPSEKKRTKAATANKEKIVLNNEYVPENNLSGESDKLSRTSSSNDQNIRTTIKVNVNLVAENESENGPRGGAKSESSGKQLTRIDQAVNSRNYERKREVASNNQVVNSNAVGNSDKENGNHA